jgi:hypothetical protein
MWSPSQWTFNGYTKLIEKGGSAEVPGIGSILDCSISTYHVPGESGEL